MCVSARVCIQSYASAAVLHSNVCAATRSNHCSLHVNICFFFFSRHLPSLTPPTFKWRIVADQPFFSPPTPLLIFPSPSGAVCKCIRPLCGAGWVRFLINIRHSTGVGGKKKDSSLFFSVQKAPFFLEWSEREKDIESAQISKTVCQHCHGNHLCQP